MYNNPVDFREKLRQKRNRKRDYKRKATQKMKSSSAGVDIELDRDRLAKPNQSTGRQQDAEVGEGAFISGPENRTEDTWYCSLSPHRSPRERSCNLFQFV